MITKMTELLAAAKAGKICRMAVAAAQDDAVLEAVCLAAAEGLVEPILIGDETAIRQIGAENGLPVEKYPVIDIPEKAEACMKAASLVCEGKADLIMKGLVDTSLILKAVLAEENHLKTGDLLCHVLLMEMPGYDRLFCISDSAMLIAPTLAQKVGIVKNALRVFRAIGNDCPRIAALCAVEKVNPKMPCTLDAAELKRMNEAGEITGCIIDGPLALDNAISPEAAKHKGINSPVAGQADMLLVPDIEAGNMLNKSMEHFGHGKKAGVIMGAKVPVVLTSRATAMESKLYSIALGVVAASRKDTE